VICQGGEGGGHTGLVGTLPLVAQAVDAVDIPVIAAGGLFDGRGLAAALALGAQGVWMGTRFIASTEAHAGDLYRQAVLEATDEDTVRTRSYSGKPMRVRKNAWVDDWEARPADIQPFPQQAIVSIQAGAMGGIGGQIEGLDPDRSCFAMGQSAGGIHDVLPAGEIVTRLVAEAEAAFQARTIEHLDPAAADMDDAGVLQHAGDGADRRALHAQHLGQRLLGQAYRFVARAVVGEQQPTADALLDRVQGVAGHHLHHLGNEGVGGAIEEVGDDGVAGFDVLQPGGRNAEGMAGHAHHGAAVGGFEAGADHTADRALETDAGGLDLLAVDRDDQQRDLGRAARQIGVLHVVAGVEQHGVDRQIDQDKMRGELGQRIWAQGGEQAI
jgi:hypothetical protein